jgi:hypothetical protein
MVPSTCCPNQSYSRLQSLPIRLPERTLLFAKKSGKREALLQKATRSMNIDGGTR